MRRICLLLVAVVIAGVMALAPGCGENSVAVQTESARADFIKAVELVNLVQLVHSASAARLTAIEKGQPFGLDGLSPDAVKAITDAKGYDEYRAAVFAAAETKLKALLDKGQTSQKVVVRQLLAQIHTLVTTTERRKALVGSDRLADEGAILVTSILNMERAHSLATRYSNDDSDLVTQLTEDQGKAEARTAELTALVKKLSGELADLEAQIVMYEKQRDEAFNKASKLRAQAFTKKGQEQYDLHIAAIEADREGFAAEQKKGDATVARNAIKTPQAEVKKADNTVEVIPAFGALVVAEHDLKISQEWSKLIQTTLGNAGTRKAALGLFDASMKKNVADTLSQQFTPAFKEVERTFKEMIEAPIDGSIKRIEDAINLASAALTMAPADKKVDAAMTVADTQLEKLGILADGVVSTARVGNMLETVLKRGTPALGDQAAAVKALLDAVAAKNTAYHAEAFKAIAAVKGMFSGNQLTDTGGENVLTEARAARVTTMKSLVNMHEAKLNGHKIAKATP